MHSLDPMLNLSPINLQAVPNSGEALHLSSFKERERQRSGMISQA